MYIFFNFMIFFMIYLSFTFAIPELIEKKNYWVILYFLVFTVNLFVPFILYAKIKKMRETINNRKGFHWEGTVLSKYKKGKDGFNIIIVMGDREFTVPVFWSDKINLGERINLVTMTDMESNNPTVLAFYPVNQNTNLHKTFSEGERLGAIYTMEEESSEVLTHLLKVSSFRLKQKGFDKNPSSVQEFLEIIRQ
ncbi:hypothetical protein [Leptospira sp. GIMC2001]|uniref:hypothetical protein n=1 Tax=Leptospira sp. GIMC2001 TaxID=1513297 RepID=UPI002349628F|nr:hypothetical protein [Leptospira sp. GIMC2001]WCL49105.1 hypothetical protein O4O04_17715 [Leptospira sp. GIMC2001]